MEHNPTIIRVCNALTLSVLLCVVGSIRAPLVSVDGSQVSVWLPMDGQMTFSLYDITKGHTPLTTSVSVVGIILLVCTTCML